MVNTVITQLSGGHLTLPAHIMLTGFDNPPPLYADLITALKNHCETVSEFSVSQLNPRVRLQACRDNDAEILGTALWAKDILSREPEASIGIICPDLHRHTAVIQRRFRDVLHPECTAQLDSDNALLFSLSAGQSLEDCQLLATALDILTLNSTWVDTLHLCRLLRSPFIAGAEAEEGKRANLELRLRDTGEMQVQLPWVRALAADTEAAYHCEQFAAALLEFDSLRRAFPARTGLQKWSNLFEAQLSTLGWPGSRISNGKEHAQLQAWSRLLKSFALISHWHGPVSLDRALTILRQLLAGTSQDVFADSAPIQVLTPTEADGLVFTHTRVLGLTEQHWPPPARPVPFIPLALQKEKKLPVSDVRLQTEAARRQLQQFARHTQAEIMFSYPCQEEDLILKPAGMLAAFTADKDDFTAEEELAQAQATGSVTEILREKPIVPLHDNEEPTGGIALIANQADCPFRAFAIHRLQAEPLPAPVIGLPGHVLGSMLHEALEILWQGLQDQAHLLASTTESLERLVKDAVTRAVQSKARFYRHTMTARFNDLEIQRLQGLLLNWLEEEKQRGAFSVVASEHRVPWQHANLNLTLRIDRLDKTADGKLVIVDYKSPKRSEINWLDTRQTEPQLMLYMLAVEAERATHVDGLFIAQVNVEESKYKGISNDDTIYPRSHYSNKRNMPEATDWQQLRLAWQDSLTQLANEFLSGYAAVNPKSVNTSCTWCHLDGFCRINDEVIQ
jgi:probable DNA repair protein